MSHHSKSVLVTGGCGFLGHHLVKRLVSEGYRTRVIDNLVTGVKGRLPSGVEEIEASILQNDALSYAMKGVSSVFHFASIHFRSGNTEREAGYEKLIETNVTGTLRVLDAAREFGVHRVINASEAMAARESTVAKGRDSYHMSQICSEQITTGYHDWYDLQTVSLRFTEIFGMGQDSVHYIIPRLVQLMLDNKDAIMVSKPRYCRDFCYVDNAVDALMLCLKADLRGSVINIGSGECNTLHSLAKAIQRIVKGSFIPKIRVGNTSCHYVYTGKVELDRAKKILGYKPRIGFETGLRRYINGIVQSQRESGKSVEL